jgi:DNA-binding GntR family transcriptional regulator
MDAEGGPRGGTLERLFAHLKEGILSGRYAPGQRLIEADLTSELGCSRGPLREAFRRLTAEGLVESVPNPRTLSDPGGARSSRGPTRGREHGL